MNNSNSNYIKAQKQIKEAEFLLNDAYNQTKDQKIFLSVLLKLFDSIQSAIDFHLSDKLASKDSFSFKLNLLAKNLKNNNLSLEDLEFIELLRKLIDYHKNSPVEFARREKFIIAEEDYSLHTLNQNNLSDYLVSSKRIVAQLLMK